MSNSKKIDSKKVNSSTSLEDITVEEAAVKTAKPPKKKSSKPNFFTGVAAEFKKVIWPSRKTLFKQTTAVIVSSIILGVIIYLVDLVVKFGIDKLVQ